MSEFAMLAAALAFVALLCVALGIVCKGLYRNQQRLLVEQAKRDACLLYTSPSPRD